MRHKIKRLRFLGTLLSLRRRWLNVNVWTREDGSVWLDHSTPSHAEYLLLLPAGISYFLLLELALTDLSLLKKLLKSLDLNLHTKEFHSVLLQATIPLSSGSVF
jgi:hypothetical protein